MPDRNTKPIPDTKPLEEQGWMLLEMEKYDDVIRVFKEVFDKDRTNVAAYQATIAASRKKRDFDKAEELLREALSLYPKHIGIISEQAWLHLAQKKYDEAIEAFNKVLLISKDENILLWKISILRGQGRFDEAYKAVEEARKLFPISSRVQVEHAWVLFHGKRYEESLSAFIRIRETNPNDASSAQGQIASLRMIGRFTEAENEFKQSIANGITSAGLLSEMGWIHFEQGQYHQAEEAFQHSLAFAPKDPYTHLNIAWALIRQGDDDDLDSATEHCRNALRLDPELSEGFGCLGVVAFKRDRLREAESHLLRSIQVDPKRGYYTDLGALYIKVGRYDEAKSTIERALSLNSSDTHAHLQLGSYYLHIEETKKAIREFYIASALDPYNPETHKSLAIALIEIGKLTEAETITRKALAKVDKLQRWELHLILCQILTYVGDETGDSQYYEEALEEAKRAMRVRSDQSAPYFYSGIVRYKLDDYRGALKDFQQCKKYKSHGLEAELNIKRIRNKMRKESAHLRVSRLTSMTVFAVLLVQLIVIWYLRVSTNSISDTMLTILVPILLGLLIIAILLPWLTKLKVTGLEAELSTPQPKEILATGPTGEMGFSKISPS
jgi:tetratricopeptide (TPR) repeat protein